MKTTVKQLATVTFIAFLLIVVNVKAEGTEIKASGSECIETTIQLEKWMTDETIWNPNSAMFTEFVQETETKLELEDWMTNEETWNSNYSFVQETEARMEIEGWMINDATWNTANMSNDPRLMTEPWMLTESYWK